MAARASRWAAPSTPHFEPATSDTSSSMHSSQASTPATQPARRRWSTGEGSGRGHETHRTSEIGRASLGPSLDIAAAVAAASASAGAGSPPPARRLSAFMRDRIDMFTPHAEEAPELDPQHRGQWTSAAPSRRTSAQPSPERSPLVRGRERGPERLEWDDRNSALQLDTGYAYSQLHEPHEWQQGSDDDAGVALLHGGEQHALIGSGSPFSPMGHIDDDDTAAVSLFGVRATPTLAPRQSVLFHTADASAPHGQPRVSFGAMPSPSSAMRTASTEGGEEEPWSDMEIVGGGTNAHPASVPQPHDPGAGGSVVASLRAALNRPSFLAAGDDTVSGMSQAMSPTQLSQANSGHNSVSHSVSNSTQHTPAAVAPRRISGAATLTPAHPSPSPSSPSAALPFSPASFFAARSAPLGSFPLSQPRSRDDTQRQRPTFNSPPYATGDLPGFMGAHAEAYFISPRPVEPVVFYRPTPGGPHDMSSAASPSPSPFTSPQEHGRAQGGQQGTATPASYRGHARANTEQRGSVGATNGYTVTVTPAAARAPDAPTAVLASSSISPLHASAGARASGDLFGASNGHGTPSPIRHASRSSDGVSHSRSDAGRSAFLSPQVIHASPVRQQAAAASAILLSAPNSASRRAPSGPSPSALRASPSQTARTSLTARFAHAARTPTHGHDAGSATNYFPQQQQHQHHHQQQLYAEDEDSLGSPPSMRHTSVLDASSGTASSFSTTAIFTASHRREEAETRTARTYDAQRQQEGEAHLASSYASSASRSPSATAPPPSSSSPLLHVFHSSRLRKLHRFALFEADPRLVHELRPPHAAERHGSGAGGRSPTTTMEALTARAKLFLEAAFGATTATRLASATPPASSHASAACYHHAAAADASLSFHSLSAHPSRPHTYTLSMVFEAPPSVGAPPLPLPLAGGAADSELPSLMASRGASRSWADSRRWMDRFEDIMGEVCARDTRKSDGADPRAAAPLQIKFIEQRPAHWQ